MKIQRALEVSQRVGLDTGPGLTEQGHKNETDMNYILRDYARTGFVRHANKNAGRYDDVAVQDFQTAMLIVTEAQDMFNELPSLVRKRFQNSPQAFLEFCADPANSNEMVRLGIAQGVDGVDAKGNAIQGRQGPPDVPSAVPDGPASDSAAV